MKNTKTAIKELTARYRAVLHKCFLLNAVALMGAFVALPAGAANISLDTTSDSYEIGDGNTWIINTDATLEGKLTGSGVLAVRPSSPGISDEPLHGDTFVTITGDISEFTGTFSTMQYGNKMNNAEATPLPNAISTIIFKPSAENGVVLGNNGIFIFDSEGPIKIISHTADSGQAKIFLNNNKLDKEANTKSYVFLGKKDANIDGGYTATLEGYNTPASIYVGGTNNTVYGDVTTVAKNSAFGNLYGNGWNSDVKGSINLTAENVNVSGNIVGNITQGALELKSLVDGDINMLVKNSTVGSGVTGQDFTFNGTTPSGTKGTTKITVEDSVIGGIRGANTNAGNQAEYGKNYFNLNDVVVTVKNSVIKTEVLAMGSYIGSAGNTILNIFGENFIGYTDREGTKSSTGEAGNVEVFAGSKRGATIQGNTTINMDTLGAHTIDILGMVNSGAHSGGDKDGYILGTSTLNLTNSGEGNGYITSHTFESHNAAKGSTFNLTNINAEASVKVDGFDVINIDDSSTLTTKALTNIGEINMAMTSTNQFAKLVVEDGYDVAETVNLKVATAGTYEGALSGVSADALVTSSLFDFDVENGDLIVSTKSADEIASNVAGGDIVTGNTIASIVSTAGNGTETANAIAETIAMAIQSGDSATAVKAAKDLAPTTSAVVMGVAKDVTSILTNVATNRMAAVGRSGGDAFIGGATWIQGLYNYSKQDSSSKTEGFDAHTAGVSFGVDGKISEDLMVGIGYGYTHTNADSGDRDLDVDGHNIFAYTEYKPSNWYVNGMVNYGFGRYEETKTPAGIALKAKYDVNTYGANIMTGYDFANGITPEAGLRYLLADQKSYNDGVQYVGADKTDVLTGVIGAKYTTDVKTEHFAFKPTLRLAATYDIVSDNAKANVNVIGGGNYEITGERLHRFGVEAGAGVETSYKNWNFSLGYNGGFRKDFQSHTGMLKAKYNF